MLDLATAAEMGRQSTGHAGAAGPAPHHVILAPGVTALAELIKQVNKGVIIFGSMGAWTGNPFGGNVTGTISLGFRIDNGILTGRIKDCMFSMNSFKHFKDHLVDISAETKSMGSATFPYVLLDDVVISTKK